MPASLPWNDTEESEVYQASVVHQLHCLDLLRIAMISYTKGEVSPHAQLGHMVHCFDIIRQGITCAGDTTLAFGEKVRREDGSLRTRYDGIGTVHNCRDWEVVKEQLEAHQVFNMAGSLVET
ncbi:hypothetical protein D0Z07_1046 [Hyphodiscus hymeniophilus]|uniref:Uncharacterized protein n=1 Tax=Hyphodiscus hymeniophilus TaxID=353542 RepID=A0A9P6VQQ6_9HELO|nr:hypothetical protein D0Z07_1046 [Hyphodiscus hymeniophilus]